MSEFWAHQSGRDPGDPPEDPLLCRESAQSPRDRKSLRLSLANIFFFFENFPFAIHTHEYT